MKIYMYTAISEISLQLGCFLEGYLALSSALLYQCFQGRILFAFKIIDKCLGM